MEEIEILHRKSYNLLAEFQKEWGLLDLPELLSFRATVGDKHSILDIGCGIGTLAYHFSAKQYTGIDISEGMVERARQLHPGYDFRQMSFRVLGFPDESFDNVAAIMSLDHEAKHNLARVLGEIARVTKRGGLLYIIIPYGEGEHIIEAHGHPEATAYISLWDQEELSHILQGAGLKVLWINNDFHHLTCFAQKKGDS